MSQISRTFKFYAAGKWYARFNITSVYAASIGLISRSSNVNAPDAWLGLDTASLGHWNSGSLINNNVSIFSGVSWFTGTTLDIAVDLDNKKCWLAQGRNTNSGWMQDIIENQNPSLNLGGVSILGLTGSPWHLAVNLFGPGQSIIADFNGSLCPIGFRPWTIEKIFGAGVSIGAATQVAISSSVGQVSAAGSGHAQATAQATGAYRLDTVGTARAVAVATSRTPTSAVGVASAVGAGAAVGRAIAAAAGTTLATATAAATSQSVTTGATLDPAHTSGNIALSNGNLTATSVNTDPGTTQSTTAHAAGKWYVRLSGMSLAGSFFAGIGVGDVSGIPGYPGSSGSFSFGHYTDGEIMIAGMVPYNTLPWSGQTAIDVAIDLDNKLYWYRPGGSGLWNDSGAADPAAGTGGFSVADMGAGTSWYFVVQFSSASGQHITVDFASAVGNPVGFLPWSGEQQPLTRPLDSVVGLYAAHGTVRLLSSYNSSLIRARRDSDNAEQDFIAGIDGWVSITEVNAWKGASTNVFVVRAYDQKGNTRDAYQSSMSLQPFLDLSGNHATIKNTGASSLPVLSMGAFDQNRGVDAIGVMRKYTSTAGTQTMVGHFMVSGNFRLGIQCITNEHARGRRLDSDTGQNTPDQTVDTEWHVSMSRADWATAKLHHNIDNTKTTADPFQTAGNTENVASANTIYGSINASSAVEAFNGEMTAGFFIQALPSDADVADIVSKLFALGFVSSVRGTALGQSTAIGVSPFIGGVITAAGTALAQATAMGRAFSPLTAATPYSKVYYDAADRLPITGRAIPGRTITISAPGVTNKVVTAEDPGTFYTTINLLLATTGLVTITVNDGVETPATVQVTKDSRTFWNGDTGIISAFTTPNNTWTLGTMRYATGRGSVTWAAYIPRLWWDATTLARFRAGSAPSFDGSLMSYMRRYLYSGNPADANSAYNAWDTGGRLSNDDVDFGTRAFFVWTDPAAILLDWCWPGLTAGQRTTLIANVEAMNAFRYQQYQDVHVPFRPVPSQIEAMFPPSSGFSSLAIIGGFVTIQGESGATDRGAALRNWVQHHVAGDEAMWRSAFVVDYDFERNIKPLYLFTYANATTDRAYYLSQAQFLQNSAEVHFRILSPGGARNIAATAGQQAYTDQFYLLPPGVTHCYLAGEMYNDPVARYTGDIINTFQQVDAEIGIWFDEIFRNPSGTRTSPASAGVVKNKIVAIGSRNVINVRSGLNIGSGPNTDINAWLYLGVSGIGGHLGGSSGHFQVYRDDAAMLMCGTTYFGSGSPDTGYSDNIARNSISRNCLSFKPKMFSPVAHGRAWTSTFHGDSTRVCVFMPADLTTLASASGQWAKVWFRFESIPIGSVFRAWIGRQATVGDAFDFESAVQLTFNGGSTTYTWNGQGAQFVPTNMSEFESDAVLMVQPYDATKPLVVAWDVINTGGSLWPFTTNGRVTTSALYFKDGVREAGTLNKSGYSLVSGVGPNGVRRVGVGPSANGVDNETRFCGQRAGSQNPTYVDADRMYDTGQFIWPFNGQIIDYQNIGDSIVLATGDLKAAYRANGIDRRTDPFPGATWDSDPELYGVEGDDWSAPGITRYLRSFVYINPGLLIVRDTYDATNTDKVRFVYHTPVLHNETSGWTLIVGSATEGVLKKAGVTQLTYTKGIHKCQMDLIAPSGIMVRATGGGGGHSTDHHGYESYVDGFDINPMIYSQQGWEDARYDAINGVWRTELETTQTSGEFYVAFVISASASPDTVSYSLASTGPGNKTLNVTYRGIPHVIDFPLNGPPVLVS